MHGRDRAVSRRSAARIFFRAALCASAAALCASCGRSDRQKAEETGEELWEVTAYCNCEKCCDWEKDAAGRPVWSKGPQKGKPKAVGVTASGRTARKGTVAADTRVLPLGTRLWVEGYGECSVDDRGGAIKGRHIDLWFPSHKEAKEWGRRMMPVRIIEKGGGK
jgi:3D (Asp-Asp-Asp) domain-containing protein